MVASISSPCLLSLTRSLPQQALPRNGDLTRAPRRGSSQATPPKASPECPIPRHHLHCQPSSGDVALPSSARIHPRWISAELTGNVARALWSTISSHSCPNSFLLTHWCSAWTSTASTSTEHAGVSPVALPSCHWHRRALYSSVELGKLTSLGPPWEEHNNALGFHRDMAVIEFRRWRAHLCFLCHFRVGPADLWGPLVSPSLSLFWFWQICCCFCKINIWSLADPNWVIQILSCSRDSLVVNKNMKHAMCL